MTHQVLTEEASVNETVTSSPDDDAVSNSLANVVNAVRLDGETPSPTVHKKVAEVGPEAETVEVYPDVEDLSPVSTIDLGPPTLWTIKDIAAFKQEIKTLSPLTVLKIGHGETATVRAPAHPNGAKLFWEFATDHFDLGFGVYFEWTIPENDSITVHISESDDEEEDDEEDEEAVSGGGAGGGERPPANQAPPGANDVEGGRRKPRKPPGPPTDEILPVYRRDSHLEVQAGCHGYAGQGVYLLKFDNTYSLWRSKWLYYRVYYAD